METINAELSKFGGKDPKGRMEVASREGSTGSRFAAGIIAIISC